MLVQGSVYFHCIDIEYLYHWCDIVYLRYKILQPTHVFDYSMHISKVCQKSVGKDGTLSMLPINYLHHVYITVDLRTY